MIYIDKRIAKIVLRESEKKYATVFLFDGLTQSFFIVPYVGSRDTIREIPLKVSLQDISASLNRLFRSGHLKKESGLMHQGCYFTMTPLLLHRFAFLLDAFTRKFWSGVLVGVTTDLVVNQLTGHVPWLFSTVLQLLKSLAGFLQ